MDATVKTVNFQLHESNLEGELGDESPSDSGCSVYFNLISGTHTITLEVEDEEGAMCLDNIYSC